MPAGRHRVRVHVCMCMSCSHVLGTCLLRCGGLFGVQRGVPCSAARHVSGQPRWSWPSRRAGLVVWVHEPGRPQRVKRLPQRPSGRLRCVCASSLHQQVEQCCLQKLCFLRAELCCRVAGSGACAVRASKQQMMSPGDRNRVDTLQHAPYRQALAPGPRLAALSRQLSRSESPFGKPGESSKVPACTARGSTSPGAHSATDCAAGARAAAFEPLCREFLACRWVRHRVATPPRPENGTQGWRTSRTHLRGSAQALTDADGCRARFA